MIDHLAFGQWRLVNGSGSQAPLQVEANTADIRVLNPTTPQKRGANIRVAVRHDENLCMGTLELATATRQGTTVFLIQSAPTRPWCLDTAAVWLAIWPVPQDDFAQLAHEAPFVEQMNTCQIQCASKCSSQPGTATQPYQDVGAILLAFETLEFSGSGSVDQGSRRGPTLALSVWSIRQGASLVGIFRCEQAFLWDTVGTFEVFSTP